MTTNTNQGGVQGEGDYEAARKFDADEREFIKSGQVAGKAREAEQALDGAEGEALEEARKAAAEGRSFKSSGHPDQVADERDPKTEKVRDKTLEDTFPASDPPSASPGAD